MRVPLILIAAAAAIALLPAAALSQPAPTKSSTVTAPMPGPDPRAREWLTLVDDGNYGESWKQATAGFRARNLDAWAKDATAMRAPLGAVASRDLKSIDLSRAQIAVVRYDTSFAHKTGAVETLTLTFDKGSWSVASYSIS